MADAESQQTSVAAKNAFLQALRTPLALLDEALRELALCDLEDPSALAKLTPVGMRKQRKRSRPDA